MSKSICCIHECGKPAMAKLLCVTHYNRLRDHGTTILRLKKKATCRMPSCQNLSRKLGWCSMHHSRIQRTGSPFDKGQSWVLGERGDCIVCGDLVLAGNGLRRYCGNTCAALYAVRGGSNHTKQCVLCGDDFSLLEKSLTSGRRRYSSASTCQKCSRTPRLAHHVPTLVKRDGSDCHLCGNPVDLTLKYPDPQSRSVDHVMPRSLGGPDSLENYKLSHLTCNVLKNNRVDAAIMA